MQLPVDLAKDQEVIVSKVLNLLSGCVDVLSSDGHLNAMSAMEMSQMVVQAMWDRDSPLKQIPHFSPEVIKAAGSFGYVFSSATPNQSVQNADCFDRAKDIFEFQELMSDSDTSKKLIARLGLKNEQLAEAANFTNDKYPSIEVEFELEDPDEITTGSPAYLKIKVEREVDEEEPDTTVHAPFYSQTKMENWWLVVGEEKTNSLLAIKRVTIGRKLEVRLEFAAPSTAGDHDLKLYLMSDSYVGVDQDPSFRVSVAEGMDEDDDEEDGD